MAPAASGSLLKFISEVILRDGRGGCHRAGHRVDAKRGPHLQQQASFDAFAHEFNAERSHEALAMKCPAELYSASPRQYDGLAGQRLGIKEVDDGIWLVSFNHYDLGYFDLEQKTLQPLDNPFGPRLSPMS